MDDKKSEKIRELKITISFLSTQTQNIIEIMDENPALAKLMLKEMFYQSQYTYN